MGFVSWHDRKVGSDASVVRLFRTAGGRRDNQPLTMFRQVFADAARNPAIPFARTTMPQTGMLLETVSNLYGRTMNPFNRGFSAGGSSGGDGSLVAMHGSPFCPSTDIGGSIRAPASFNGLYGIRPTADRIPKSGMSSAAPGQVSVKVSSGPVCHSMEDIKLVTKLLLTHGDYIGFEPTAVPLPWKEHVSLPERLTFGLLKTDGCVEPQPPVARSLNETAATLKAAGHNGTALSKPGTL